MGRARRLPDETSAGLFRRDARRLWPLRRCEGVRARPLPPARYVPPGEAEAGPLRQLRAEGHDALATPRQLARFLCGIASPATTRAKLRTHALFGAFESVPFQEVLSFVERQT